MSIWNKLIVSLAFTIALVVTPSFNPIVPGEAFAAQSAKDKRKPKRKTRRAKVLSKKVFESLTKVQEMMELNQYAEASRELDDLLTRKLSKYEQAMALQTYAYVYSAQENYSRAAQLFERVLSSGGLDEQQLRTALYNLAQLYMVIGQLDLGIQKLEQWFVGAENPAPDAYILLANAYAQKEAYRRAIPLVEKGLSISSDPKERWYQLLMALYYEEKQFSDVGKVLEILVTRWPHQRRYWLQLSAIYGTLEKEKKSLSVMEMAYKQGYLKKSTELVNLAQLYLYQEVPYRAAMILEKGFDDGLIEETKDNWALLSNSLMGSEEYKRALAPLSKAAKLADDGELYLRLAQAHFADESWKASIKSLGDAFKKGELDNAGRAYMLLGVANYNIKRYKSSISAFEKATKTKRTRKNAGQWIRHVKQEMKAAS